MRIAISAESTIDLPKELLEKYHIHTLPFTVLMGDIKALDGQISPEEIFTYVNKNKVLPKTSAVNTYQFEEHFNNLLKDYDYIIHFSLSSKISSAYANANIVASDNPNIKIIDSESLSTGIALEAIYASTLVDQGMEFNDIVNHVLSRVSHVQASFILERLDYLYMGGRCNALQLFGANLLKLHPQIIVQNGKMVVGKKYRGKMEANTLRYVLDTLDRFNNPDKELVFITYSTAKVETVEAIKTILKERGFRNIYVTRAGCTISSHCGDGCLGILYINDGDRK
ncbi:MAG: DegV family protein [Bacilli bacterium]|nr:DegV family protein [Bacilli bacterium]